MTPAHANTTLPDPPQASAGPTDGGTLAQPPGREVPPIPPRFWWLNRLIAASVVLILALIALRIWWGWEAQRRLDAAIARYRAAGQPVLAEDFDAALDAVPDEDNAAVLYLKAMDRMVLAAESGVTVRDSADDRTMLDTHAADAAELMEANAELFALVHEARTCDEIAWPLRVTGRIDSFAQSGALDLNSSWRDMGRVLYFAVLREYYAGDHARALELLHDGVHFAQAIPADPSVISALVGWTVERFLLSVLEDHGSGLAIGPEVSADVRQAASRMQVIDLIRGLLDEEAHRAAAVRVYRGERAACIDFYPKVLSEGRKRFGLTWEEVIYGPLVEHDLPRLFTAYSRLAKASQAPNWEAAQEQIAANSPDSSWLRRRSQLLSSIVAPSGGRSLLHSFRLLAIRRMAAVALAIRLYEIDHGHRPQVLSALVPQYLSQLPVDPFSPDGATFRYKPGAPRAMLYSLDGDGDDDGGRPRQPGSGGDHDWPFYLDPETEGPPPSTKPPKEAPPSRQTGEDDQHPGDHQRNNDQRQPGQGDPQ